MLLTALTYIVGGTLAGKIVNNLMMVAIALAVLVVSNGITGVVSYISGHNAAAAQCKVNTIIRERDELKRDRDVQVATGNYLKGEVARLSNLQAQREQKEAEDAAKVTPIDGCVVPARSRRMLKRAVK